MLNIDGLAYTNRLRGVHPLEKAVFAFLTLLLCLGFSSPVISCLVILMMALVIVRIAGIPAKTYFKLMFLPFSFLLIGVLTIAVTITTKETTSGWLVSISALGVTVGITYDGLVMAGSLACKSLGAVSCLYFLSLTTPAVEIISVMRKFKFPSLFLELTDLVYRFIFVMLAMADEVRISQSSRWGYATLKNSMVSFGQLTAALFIKSIHHSRTLFTALSARGYTGQLNVIGPQYSFSVTNIILIVIVETVLVVTAILLEVGKIG